MNTLVLRKCSIDKAALKPQAQGSVGNINDARLNVIWEEQDKASNPPLDDDGV